MNKTLRLVLGITAGVLVVIVLIIMLFGNQLVNFAKKVVPQGIEQNTDAYCLQKPGDDKCYHYEDFTCNELCENKGRYDGSYMVFAPLVPYPDDPTNFMPDPNSDNWVGATNCKPSENPAIHTNAAGCGNDCQKEEAKRLAETGKYVMGNCCCN